MKYPFKEVHLVFWKDAYVTTDDNPKLDHKDDSTISIGVIVEETDSEITMSTFYDGISLQFGSPYQVIPKGMVRCIKKLKIPKLSANSMTASTTDAKKKSARSVSTIKLSQKGK